jgi:hypothetical protein
MSEAAVIVRHNLEGKHRPTAGSVLIIDDEAAIRESLETLLELEGYGVESAAAAKKGLTTHRRTKLRPGPARPGAARSQRHGPFSRDSPAGSGALDHHGHRLLDGRECGKGNAGGRSKFRPEAMGQREVAGRCARCSCTAHRAEEENVQLKRALKQRYNFENIVGKSEPMLKIFDLVAQVAPSRSTVLCKVKAGPARNSSPRLST